MSLEPGYYWVQQAGFTNKPEPWQVFLFDGTDWYATGSEEVQAWIDVIGPKLSPPDIRI